MEQPGDGSALAFTIGLCPLRACAPLVGHAVLAYPSGRLASRWERWTVGVAYAGGVARPRSAAGARVRPEVAGRAGNVRATCSSWPTTDAPSRAEPGRRVRRWRVGDGALRSWCSLRLFRATSAARRPGWPVLAAGAAYLALVAATFAASIDRGLLSNGTLERRLWLGEAAALSAISLGVAFGLARARRARAAVARSRRRPRAVASGRRPAGGSCRDRRRLRRSCSAIRWPVPGSSLTRRAVPPTCPCAASGRPSGRRWTPSRDAGTRARAARRFAAGRARSTAAARLALENERLQAEVRAQLEELRASRARIVDAGDAERKRLERDLHDGAQQRLVALALSLRLAAFAASAGQLRAGRLSTGRRRRRAGTGDLGAARARARDLPHGARRRRTVRRRPRARRGESGPDPDPTRSRWTASRPRSRLPPIRSWQRHARVATSTIVVQGERRDGTLVVEVETHDEGRALDPVALEDRLGALDGTLCLEHSTNGRVTIRAELPCGS